MNQKILYLDCSSGISGDMTVAALLDLGANRQVLQNALESLPLTGYSIEIKDVWKSGIRACDFHVILDAEHENHDHDMNYLYGHDNVSSHVHAQNGSSHTHAASRNLQDIIAIIHAGSLSENASGLAIRIFEILAKAEAEVHGKEINEVHFHEVGAVDSIVDITAAAVCLDNLQPDQVIVSALTEGCGQIRCQHGLIPVPVPAVTAISTHENLVLKFTDISGELVTPTGAAIAAAIRTSEKLPVQFRIRKVGYGAGKRDYAAAGILRAMWIEPESGGDEVLVLETNIDDCTGEALSFTMQKLMEAGALDVFYLPIYMKKNRPAYLLNVICQTEDRRSLESIIFQNTTTIGIRRQTMQRTRLDRRIVSIDSPWGIADIKCCDYEKRTVFFPESDSVSRLADKNGIGFSEMYRLLQSYSFEHINITPSGC